MRIFILEDNPFRMEWFNKEFIGHEVHHCDEAEIAIDMIQFNKYDMIFLDHDLGGESMVDGEQDPNTGLAVAKIIPLTHNKDTKIIIHSLNPVGVQRMYTYLSQGGCADVACLPFGQFTFNTGE